jgi:hypothetical protein
MVQERAQGAHPHVRGRNRLRRIVHGLVFLTDPGRGAAPDREDHGVTDESAPEFLDVVLAHCWLPSTGLKKNVARLGKQGAFGCEVFTCGCAKNSR